MNKISTSITLIVTLGVAVTSVWAYQRYLREDAIDYLEVEVQQGPLEEVIRVRGEVVSEKEYELEFPFLGIIEEVYVKEGEMVEKGQKLAKLETIDYELELRELQAQLAQARANVESTEAQVAQAKAAVSAAKEKIRQSESFLDEQRSRLLEIRRGNRKEQIAVAESTLATAQQNLESAQINLENTQEQAAEDLQTDLETAQDLLQLSSVTATKVLRENAQEVIYPFPYPRERTCELQYSFSETGDIIGSCTAILPISDRLEELAEASIDLTDADQLIANLKQSKKDLEALRNFFRDLSALIDNNLNVSNNFQSLSNTQLMSLKTSLSQGQIELESLISKLTTQSTNISNQQVLNKSTMDSANNAVKAAEEAVANAKAELKLQSASALPEVIAAQEARVEQASAQFRASQSQLEEAEARVLSEQARIKQAQADISIIAARIEKTRENIKKSTLYAPADTKVVKVWVEEGEVFGSDLTGQTAIALSSTGFELEADVSELDIGKVRETNGNDIIVRLDAFPGVDFTGKIMSIEPQEILKDGDRYYRVNASLSDTELPLRSGMSADLFIQISAKENVIKIPEYAVYNEEGQDYITIMRGEEIIERPVITGISDGDYIEIQEGLEEGETVVVSTE